MKTNWKYILFWIAIGLAITFVLINGGWSVYAFVKYGGKPLDQIPTWALWYMFRW